MSIVVTTSTRSSRKIIVVIKKRTTGAQGKAKRAFIRKANVFSQANSTNEKE
jgi:hypothetical protein